MFNNAEYKFTEYSFNIIEDAMFVGRKRELEILQKELQKKSTAVMIYGKRKIGKTTLIKQAVNATAGRFVYFECLKGTMRENIDAFTAELVRAGVFPAPFVFNSFIDLFAYLNTLPGSLTVIIDEYPYLKYMNPAETVDSIFQSIIDNRISNIRLILSGSHIAMMKDLLKEDNALYGRFKQTIVLRELNYLLSSVFYNDLSPYDKAAFYGVFGGSPYILEQLDAGKSLRENIEETLLNENNAVYIYADQLLLSDYSASMNAERIFSVLGNGSKRYKEIEQKLDMNRTGMLSKQLKQLTELEIIGRNIPINKPDDKKKATYFINDNLLRFFYTYIYRNKSALQMLGPDAFYETMVAPTISDFVSRRFEGVCRQYFSLMVRSGRIKGVRNIGSYYYDDPVHKKNGEFDVALDYGDSCCIIEAKYFSKPMESDEIHHEISQMEEIQEINVRQYGFVSVHGFENRENGYLYFDGDDLYDPALIHVQ